MEETLTDRGMKVRREGRVMRVGHNGDNTYNEILQAAADIGTQVRRMHDHEASLEDLFLVIMERLGHDVKTSDDLLEGHEWLMMNPANLSSLWNPRMKRLAQKLR